MAHAIDSAHIILRELEEKDLSEIAAVHMDSFTSSALTKLGANVVERYYLWQLTGPHKIVRAVGAFVNDDCAGFSFSGVFDGSTSGFLSHNKFYLLKEVLTHPWLLLNSLFISRVVSGVRILRRFSGKKGKTSESRAKRTKLPFGVLSIAVSNKFQKLGIGKLLLVDAENQAVQHGFEQIELTVSPTNYNAVRFYENLNWKRLPADELWSGYMVKDLKGSSFEKVAER